MKIKQVNQEILKAIKAPNTNIDSLLLKISNQEQEEKISKLKGKVALDPSILEAEGGEQS